MRIRIFIAGLSIIAFGVFAHRSLMPNEAFPLLQGTLTLGGSLIIAGLFSLKSYWHGVIAAGILSLIGFAFGITKIPKLLAALTGTGERNPLSVIEFGVTLLCLFLLLRVVRALRAHRAQLLREQEERSNLPPH